MFLFIYCIGDKNEFYHNLVIIRMNHILEYCSAISWINILIILPNVLILSRSNNLIVNYYVQIEIKIYIS